MTTLPTTSLVSSQSDRLRIFLHAILFVLGFSLVFVIGWGGSVTLLGQMFGMYKRIIAQIGGVIVILSCQRFIYHRDWRATADEHDEPDRDLGI